MAARRLVPMNDLLADAEERGYAVGAVREAMKKLISERMRLFGSAGMAERH